MIRSEPTVHPSLHRTGRCADVQYIYCVCMAILYICSLIHGSRCCRRWRRECKAAIGGCVMGGVTGANSHFRNNHAHRLKTPYSACDDTIRMMGCTHTADCGHVGEAASVRCAMLRSHHRGRRRRPERSCERVSSKPKKPCMLQTCGAQTLAAVIHCESSYTVYGYPQWITAECFGSQPPVSEYIDMPLKSQKREHSMS